MSTDDRVFDDLQLPDWLTPVLRVMAAAVILLTTLLVLAWFGLAEMPGQAGFAIVGLSAITVVFIVGAAVFFFGTRMVITTCAIAILLLFLASAFGLIHIG